MNIYSELLSYFCSCFKFKELCFWHCLGLVHEDCIAKMRMISLVDLASDESAQIPYSVVKDTLQVYTPILVLSVYMVVKYSESGVNYR